MTSPKTLHTAIAALTLTLAASSIAPLVMAADIAPSFATHKVSDSKIRAGITAFQKGKFSKAAFFQKAAIENGLSKSRKVAAYTNLCAAEGAQNQLEAAIVACDTALEIAPDAWRALNNRGVVHWLSGEQVAAARDFSAGLQLNENNVLLAKNAELAGGEQLALAD